jgi:hypothetical protein
MSIAARLGKLERAMHPQRVIVLWRHCDEPTNEGAYARWIADHPNEPPPSDSDTNVIIVKWSKPQ